MAASHASTSGAAGTGSSYGANSTSNHEESSEFLNNCYAKITAETTDLCAALQHHLKAIYNYQPPIRHGHGDSSLEAVARLCDALHSFSTVLDGKLESLTALKITSTVFFAAAAAITAAVAAANSKRPAAAAAAAASILFVGMGNWVHSMMKKRERAVEKRKKIVGVMIMGAKICSKDLADIHAMARRLRRNTESMSEYVDGEKTAALTMGFEELRRKAGEYSRDVDWVREVVLQSIIDHLN